MIDKCMLKPNKWVWVVSNENEHRQSRRIALFLQKDDLGDCWVCWKEGNGSDEKFVTGQVSIGDLIPLHNCTGWNYFP